MVTRSRALLLFLTLAALWLLARSWAADDAFITWRVLDNAMHGHGLRWNVDERVLVSTHPLWLLLQLPVYAVLRSGPWTGFVLSLPLALGTLWLLGRRGWPWALLLLLSRSWADFAVSGLEAPLTALLVVGFGLALPPAEEAPRWGLLTGLAGLAVLARPDAAWLFAPALVWLGLRRGVRWGPALLGLLPLLAWVGFATLYFGTPIPNPAFAKLATGIPRSTVLLQGLAWAGVSALYDPVGVLLLVLGAWAAWRARPDPRPALLMAGAGLLLVWCVWIGGGFMAGRFAVPALAAAAVVWSRWGAGGVNPPATRWVGAALALAVLSAGARLALPPRPLAGVMDERHARMGTNSLAHPVHTLWRGRRILHSRGASNGHRLGQEALAEPAPYVVERQAVGMEGLYAGPAVFLVDRLGITEPLLARLPAAEPAVFRPGHVHRSLPEGYLEARHSGDLDKIKDPSVRTCYEDLRLLTSAPLLDPRRASAALRVGWRSCP